ncbi:MAG TPA: hypothetical protein VJO53_06970 [Candidatus Acidoferrales bacterium]|nr:hypothetical protein [Candidatus Acidoferrales bacterium]
MLFARRGMILTPMLLSAVAFMPPCARGQVDLSGEWSQTAGPDNTTDPDIGDYTGLPINDAERMRADSWTAEKWDQEEHECEPHPADYAFRAPGGLRIWPDVDPLTKEITAWHTMVFVLGVERTIYMDGRPRPPAYAAQTWAGFSTGKWVGDKLQVITTDLKEGWLRRNGLARSDKANAVEYFIRHGDFLTIVSIVNDPVYLTEPLVRTEHWALNPGYNLTSYNCIPKHEVDKPRGWVPHHLPGTNEWLTEFPTRFGIPVEAARGGAETMYPEYMKKLATLPPPPPPKPKQPAARQ